MPAVRYRLWEKMKVMANQLPEKGHLIDNVAPGSPAEKAGIKVGWRLLRIDSQVIGDLIDYRILEADEQHSLLVLTDDGKLKRIKIRKPAGGSLGLRFDPLTIDRLQSCPNHCLFCFVDQNPQGLRNSLYVKDDDYRLSFLYGNFITLNRVREKDLKRIIRLQMSPLYVSVHTTNPELRVQMMGSKLAKKGLANLKQLVAAGIKIHSQLVLCPDLNTGKELERSIADLAALGENILSVAVVPVGLTMHRPGNSTIRGFRAAEARILVEQIEALQKKYLAERKSRFVFLSDEFYNLASLTYPPDIAYEGYPQLENGVGLARLFLEELEQLDEKLPQLISSGRELTITLVTGKAALPVLEKLAETLRQVKGLFVNLIAADNYFFGKQVTVSGLLTGSDLIKALEKEEKGDLVFIANNLLRDGGDLFLDNLSVEEVEAVIKVPLKVVKGPLELIDNLSVYLTGNYRSEPEGEQL
jgi:putative radical SAM enzyme (TIGR03279 family)